MTSTSLNSREWRTLIDDSPLLMLAWKVLEHTTRRLVCLAVVAIELSQEETLNEFSDQLNEYTKNYRNAIMIGDQDGAGKWAMLRLRLLENMIKISGLDKRAEMPTATTQEALSSIPYEEVKRRAIDILTRTK